MVTWKQVEAANAEVKVAKRAFERLNEETRDEARDEEGWTPELTAAARRWTDASLKWSRASIE
jgi:hypothetical protein